MLGVHGRHKKDVRNFRSERLSHRGLGKLEEDVVVVRDRWKASEGRGE